MVGLCPATTWGSKGGHRERSEQAVPPFMAEKSKRLAEMGLIYGFSALSIPFILAKFFLCCF